MNLRKFAARGLIWLTIAVALCMFFSGTIKTITTAKVKLTRGRMGKLEEKVELSGELAFPDVEQIRFELEEEQSLLITNVNVRVGYVVSEGDVIIEARVADYAGLMRRYQQSYDEALDALLLLESKNSGIRLRRTDEAYSERYFALRDAKKAAMAAKVEMDVLLSNEQLSITDSGVPDGASEVLIEAIGVWRAAVDSELAAQIAMDEVERYKPDEQTWAYISEKHSCEEKMAEAEAQMQALGELEGSVRAIRAPHDGYVAEILVKAGDSYDGNAGLFAISAPEKMPVLRADVTDIDRVVAQGMSVSISTDRYGVVETQVVATGVNDEGKKYVDVEVNEQVLSARGSIYSMTVEETPMMLVFRSQQSTTLITTGALHGVGEDRYVYVVDTFYSSFGNSKMTVNKMPVTVLAEADGMASIQEELDYRDIAYMEDRPINDGDTVMLYIE